MKTHSRFAGGIVIVACASLMVTGAVGCGQGDPKPQASFPEYEGPERPTLSSMERQEAKRVLTQDPYFDAVVKGRGFEYESISVWARPNQEEMGAGIFVKLPGETDFSMRKWPMISNGEALDGGKENSPDSGGLEAGVLPEVEYVMARVKDATGFLAFVDLTQDRVVSLSPQGLHAKFIPKDKSLYRSESEGD